MRLSLEIHNTEQIDLSIEAVERASKGLPMRAVDLAPLVGVLSILEAIRDRHTAVVGRSEELRAMLRECLVKFEEYAACQRIAEPTNLTRRIREALGEER